MQFDVVAVVIDFGHNEIRPDQQEEDGLDRHEIEWKHCHPLPEKYRIVDGFLQLGELCVSALEGDV